jgi:cellulose biosynthesis protein BcsQ
MGVIMPFANGKGGVGKSTLACSYAVEAAKAGVGVVIADLNDEQHTAATWAATRHKNGYKPDIEVEVAQPRRVLDLARRCELLIVDTPSWTNANNVALARLASFVVVPTGPQVSPEIMPTIQLLRALSAALPSWQVGVALTRFNANVAEGEEKLARAVLAKAGYSALAGVVRQVPSFGLAFAEGHGLSETSRETLNKEALELLSAIAGGLDAACERLVQEREQSQTLELERGGRER